MAVTTSASLFSRPHLMVQSTRIIHMADTEQPCMRTLVLDNHRESYQMAFSENNPSITFQDRTTESGGGDLKDVFSKFDCSAPIATEILSRARFLCAKYLGGAWTKIQLNEFQLKAITGGMSNLLFLVELPNGLKPQGLEPTRALLRIHCQADLEQLLSESVVFTLLSERGLGPKLHGVFPGGRFEQFIPSRPLECPEISQRQFAVRIAPMLARVHTLDVPITKDPEVMTCTRNWINKFKQTPASRKPIDIYTTVAELDRSEYPASITVEEFEKEIDFVQHFLENSRSPIVFSHNDLQEGNILLNDGFELLEDGSVLENGQKSDVDNPLSLIDFEYSNYNYRGFDLGNHMCEYGYDYDCDKPPYYKIHQKMFDAKEERRIFCSAYVDEVYRMRDLGENPHFPSDLVTGNKEEDVEKLIEESYLFMPVSNLFWTAWALYNGEHSVIAFDYKAYARDRLALYYHQKPQMEAYLKRCS